MIINISEKDRNGETEPIKGDFRVNGKRGRPVGELLMFSLNKGVFFVKSTEEKLQWRFEPWQRNVSCDETAEILEISNGAKKETKRRSESKKSGLSSEMENSGTGGIKTTFAENSPERTVFPANMAGENASGEKMPVKTVADENVKSRKSQPAKGENKAKTAIKPAQGPASGKEKKIPPEYMFDKDENGEDDSPFKYSWSIDPGQADKSGTGAAASAAREMKPAKPEMDNHENIARNEQEDKDDDVDNVIPYNWSL